MPGDWSDDDKATFNQLKLLVQLTCGLTKCIQIVAYIFLVFYFCRKIKQIGDHTFAMVICFLMISNGLFSVASVALLLPVNASFEIIEQKFKWFCISYAFEVATFNICQWLYSFKSYYNTREIKLMFSDREGNAEATNFRKNLYLLTITTNSLVIFLVSCVLAYCYMVGVAKMNLLAALC